MGIVRPWESHGASHESFRGTSSGYVLRWKFCIPIRSASVGLPWGFHGNSVGLPGSHGPSWKPELPWDVRGSSEFSWDFRGASLGVGTPSDFRGKSVVLPWDSRRISMAVLPWKKCDRGACETDKSKQATGPGDHGLHLPYSLSAPFPSCLEIDCTSSILLLHAQSCEVKRNQDGLLIVDSLAGVRCTPPRQTNRKNTSSQATI